MKITVSTYSYGGYAQREDFGIFACIDNAIESGADAIEVVEGTFAGSDSPEIADQVKAYCEKKGIVVSSCCFGADFLNGSDGDLSAEITKAKKMIDLTERYGAKIARFDVSRGYDNGKKHSIGYQNALPRLVEAARSLADYGMNKGILICTENHGQFSEDSERIEQLINAVAHDNYGALVDIGNFLCVDEDPIKAVGRLAPYAVHVHAKDFHIKSGMERFPGTGWWYTRGGNYFRGAIIGHGDARAEQSLAILKRAGYDGFISIEFEGLEDNLLGIRECIHNVRLFWDEAK